jgi:hypothetical protein
MNPLIPKIYPITVVFKINLDVLTFFSIAILCVIKSFYVIGINDDVIYYFA